jgi:adenosylcobinamide-GDP ribazoletransferase
VAAAKAYLDALSFLTRLGPARPDPDLAAGLPWFPAVGATLGLVLTVPLALGLLAAHPLAAAFVYAVANIACTRGLHLDGFADVADAWGSLARGERFFAIMKDSRVGAFGGMALVVAVVGQTCLGAELLGAGRLWMLAVSPALGRAAAVVLIRVCRDIPRPGLGSLCLAGATGPAVTWAVGSALVFSLVLAGPRATAFAAMLCAVVVWTLARLARSNGAINGDFIGAAVVAGELAACLGALL